MNVLRIRCFPLASIGNHSIVIKTHEVGELSLNKFTCLHFGVVTNLNVGDFLSFRVVTNLKLDF